MPRLIDINEPWDGHNVQEVHELLKTLLPARTLTEITYSELKALRDSGELVAGMQYRITDYHTRTVQENTQSADHQFDIIVIADDAAALNENARACLHAGDTYFSGAGAKLEAWKLKYSIDNDAEKYVWADSTNGKGVIWWMKDEWNNECPYDFKNIMFKRFYDSQDEMYKKGDSENNQWCYTFCMLDKHDGQAHDVSVEQFKYPSDEKNYYLQRDNVIAPYIDNFIVRSDDEPLGAAQKLNDTVFVTDTELCSIAGDYSYGEFYGYYGNRIGVDNFDNTIGNDFARNSIGSSFNNNTIGSYFNNNTIGNEFARNSIGNDFARNSIGSDFYSNSIGSYFNNNTIGNDFARNSIGSSFNNNTIGSYFYDNSIGNDFARNSIGSSFHDNTIGSGFVSNSIGSSFYNNTIGNYVAKCAINDGVTYVHVPGGTSSSNVQNCHVFNGVQGVSSSSKLTISFIAGKKYTQFASLKSDGTLEVWTR